MQINTVHTFTENNGLTLNPMKCDVVLVSSSKPTITAPIAMLEGKSLTLQLHAKCLGYWWCWDLSATNAVDEAINKARQAFFAFGAMGAFQGQLNPQVEVYTKPVSYSCFCLTVRTGC